MAPLQPRRRAMGLDPTRLPFEEPEARVPNRLPSMNGQSSSSTSSCPPTRERSFLSPLRLPTPPGTDPPRRRKQKKHKSISTSCLHTQVPASSMQFPHSPLPLPPGREKPLCSTPSTTHAAADAEEFPMSPGSLVDLEDLQEEEVPLAGININRPIEDMKYPIRPDSKDLSVHQGTLDSDDDKATRTPGPESRERNPVVVDDQFSECSAHDRNEDSIVTQRMDDGTPNFDPDDMCADSFGMENCPDLPELLRGRTDCDYWDRSPQSSLGGPSALCSARSARRVSGARAVGTDRFNFVDSIDDSRTPFPFRHRMSALSPVGSPKLRTCRSDDTATSQDRNDVVRGGLFTWVRGEMVGRGSLGSVWKALNRSNGQLMAVKEVPLDASEEDDRFRAALQNEIDLYKDLCHPHIVSYLGNDYLDGRLFIYLEYMPGGSIAQVLSQFGPLDEPLVARYARHLLEGLEYLHTRSPPVLHRDIKGANILVGLDRTVKLSDFGCSKRSAGTMVHTLRGSVPWMAPEVMRQSGYGRKADVWSFGCVLIEMATAKCPWGSFDNHLAAMVRIAMSDETPEIPGHLSGPGHDLIRICTVRNAEERPYATQLLCHDFLGAGFAFTGIDESWGP